MLSGESAVFLMGVAMGCHRNMVSIFRYIMQFSFRHKLSHRYYYWYYMQCCEYNRVECITQEVFLLPMSYSIQLYDFLSNLYASILQSLFLDSLFFNCYVSLCVSAGYFLLSIYNGKTSIYYRSRFESRTH